MHPFKPQIAGVQVSEELLRKNPLFRDLLVELQQSLPEIGMVFMRVNISLTAGAARI